MSYIYSRWPEIGRPFGTSNPGGASPATFVAGYRSTPPMGAKRSAWSSVPTSVFSSDIVSCPTIRLRSQHRLSPPTSIFNEASHLDPLFRHPTNRVYPILRCSSGVDVRSIWLKSSEQAVNNRTRRFRHDDYLPSNHLNSPNSLNPLNTPENTTGRNFRPGPHILRSLFRLPASSSWLL